ncbi:MAG: YebC/PmpR family DNA-binding transcriptional regulator [Bacteroidia bacterium]|nr:YebC/PmpR family DNA-binding transcriptional regulator [Bacteroidia bacterium]
MSGHSKWATIKRKKAALDSKRSAVFTKLLREVTVAAKLGGPSPEANARLRLAIQAAKKSSVPKDAIERAVNKGGDADSATLQEVVYEGYGPHGVAILIECTTDNPTRTVANMRMYLSRGGGALGVSGSVDYLFQRKGVFTLPVAAMDEEMLTLELLEAGIEDIETDGEFYTITCPFEAFGAVNAKLEALKLEAESSELSRIPMTSVPLTGEALEKVLGLIEKIEDDDDVAKVFHNLELTDEVLESV